MRTRILVTTTLLFAALTGAAYWLCTDLHTPAALPVGGAMVSVATGERFRTTATRLQAAGVVRHAWVLQLAARWLTVDRLVRSGEFRFTEPLTPLQVLTVLRSPTAAVHRVTVPEGSTVGQVATLFAEAGFGGVDQFLCRARDPDFLQHLALPASGVEGYLFPDTYAVAWSTSPAEILTTMVARFRERASGLEAQRRTAGMSQQDMVVLASLIEKETAAADERVLVSSVFHNRLRLGMPLQSDPTTVYGREGHGAPTVADLAVASPYNTYRHTGLPPGPICNPGFAALAAAVTPTASPYLYFVSRKDGTHAFSRTLEEHNRAVERFQRGRFRPGE